MANVAKLQAARIHVEVTPDGVAFTDVYSGIGTTIGAARTSAPALGTLRPATDGEAAATGAGGARVQAVSFAQQRGGGAQIEMHVRYREWDIGSEEGSGKKRYPVRSRTWEADGRRMRSATFLVAADGTAYVNGEADSSDATAAPFTRYVVRAPIDSDSFPGFIVQTVLFEGGTKGT